MFTSEDFKEYLKTLRDEGFYDTIREISKTSSDNPFIDDASLNDFQMYSLDDVVTCQNEKIREKVVCGNCEGSECNLNFQHASADAFHVYFSEDSVELYFIEFKKKDIFDTNALTYGLEETINNLIEEFEAVLNDPTKISQIEPFFGDEEKLQKDIKALKRSKKETKKYHTSSLKLKALESLLCIIPWSYEIYCHKHDNLDFKEFLLNCKKFYIIICNKDRQAHSRNRSSDRVGVYRRTKRCENNPYDIQRLTHHPFNKILIRNPVQFKRLINEISN